MRTTASGATPRKACWQKPWRIGTSASCGRSDAGVLSHAIATDNRRQRGTHVARNCSKVVGIGPETVKVLPDPIRRREAQLHSKNAAVHGEPAE
jgi:hypothetical protein